MYHVLNEGEVILDAEEKPEVDAKRTETVLAAYNSFIEKLEAVPALAGKREFCSKYLEKSTPVPGRAAEPAGESAVTAEVTALQQAAEEALARLGLAVGDAVEYNGKEWQVFSIRNIEEIREKVVDGQIAGQAYKVQEPALILAKTAWSEMAVDDEAVPSKNSLSLREGTKNSAQLEIATILLSDIKANTGLLKKLWSNNKGLKAA